MVSLSKFSEKHLENPTVSIWGTVTAQIGYANGQSASQSQMAYDLKLIAFPA
jgi:hypothetical protein